MLNQTFNYDAVKVAFDASPFKQHFFGSFDRFFEKLKEHKDQVLEQPNELIVIPFRQGTNTFMMRFTICKDEKKAFFSSVTSENGTHPMMDPVRELIINNEFKEWFTNVIQAIVHEFKAESLVMS